MSLKEYDIVLTFLFGRIHNYYLGIINALSKEYHIGIFILNHKKAKKTSKTNKGNLEYCKKLGAEIISKSCSVRTKLLFIPQYNLGADVIAQLLKMVVAKKIYSLQSFGLGIANLDKYVSNNINNHIVFDRKIFEEKLKTAVERKFADENLLVKVMGDVFAKYPLEEKIECDYMIAFPTNMSFEDDWSKRIFMGNILKMLGTLKDKVIVFKIHNVRDRGNRICDGRVFNSIVDRFALPLPILVVLNYLSDIILSRKKNRICKGLVKMLLQVNIAVKYSLMLKKTIPLSLLTKYSNLGIEIFLSGVKRGVITGRSSCVWHALVQNVHVYNCDNITSSQIENVRDSYEVFGIPPCFGILSFRKEHFNKISTSVRNADLIKLIREELVTL